MSDTVKLIIEIPEEEYKRMTEESIYSTHVMICAIQNGIPLDDVKAEISNIDSSYERDGCWVMADVLKVFDNIGKAESEDKE